MEEYYRFVIFSEAWAKKFEYEQYKELVGEKDMATIVAHSQYIALLLTIKRCNLLKEWEQYLKETAEQARQVEKSN